MRPGACAPSGGRLASSRTRHARTRTTLASSSSRASAVVTSSPVTRHIEMSSWRRAVRSRRGSIRRSAQSSRGTLRMREDRRASWAYPVIIDNMMNLEMLSGQLHTAVGPEMARSGRATRVDVGARARSGRRKPAHVALFNPNGGALLGRVTWQGYADSSVWARGQAWAIYRFSAGVCGDASPRVARHRAPRGGLVCRAPSDGRRTLLGFPRPRHSVRRARRVPPRRLRPPDCSSSLRRGRFDVGAVSRGRDRFPDIAVPGVFGQGWLDGAPSTRRRRASLRASR